MDKIECRAVIKYFVLKGLTPTQIKEEMDSTLGDSAPSLSTIKKLAADFKLLRQFIIGRWNMDSSPHTKDEEAV